MTRYEELDHLDSCFNRAKPDELVFVLLERDEASASTIRYWASERIRLGKNGNTDAQIVEALILADEIDAKNAKKGNQCPTS